MGRHDEIKLGLENMEKLCAELKQPQNDVKTIHIAGTNGKGSTGSFIYSVLRECGYKVGRYTSPAVFDSREKFQINDRYISDEEIQKYRKIVLKAAENTECVPTVFEVETTMAFCFFSVNKCDYSLIECGMGGRLDATNVCGNVAAAVITSISLDHTDFLGDTTEKIAEEKSGIIKNGARVVVFKQGENIMKIIKEKCRKENCEMIYADKENIINTKYENDVQSFEYKGMKIETSLLGAHQRENCITAVECCRALGIDDEKIIKGIKNAKWNGRFETIRENPRIIIDGAHNEDAVNRLKENVDIYYKG
ncbi:MAG: bifunctional folylpolyglutamate synthase/dihydrofolate synthase, partial [Firmicutes bacterium]|nr:bifunctional folylpolyglutamate synthase/dihydrofolate synthase [Bacillota bacterium]